MKIYDEFENDGARVFTVSINSWEFVDVKACESGFIYVLQNEDGYEVYSEKDNGHRSLTKTETDRVVQYVEMLIA